LDKPIKKMRRIASSELITVITVMGLGVLAMSVLQPVLPLYLTSVGVSPEILGLMFSVAMVGMVFGESFWGWVADKSGLKLPLSMGTTICGLIVFCFVFTQNIPIIFLIFLFWGIARSALFGPGRGYIGATAPPLRKATYMAIISVMLSASRSIGALPSGFIADAWGYNSVFFVACGIALIGGIVVLIGLRKRRLVEFKSASVPMSPSGKLPSRVLTSSYRPLASQCIVANLQFMGLGIFMTYLPLIATQVIGVSATQVGILFTIGGLVSVVLAIPMGMMADRVGKKTFMILGLLVSAVAMAGIAFAESFPWLIIFVIVRSVAMTMFSPAALGLLSDSIPLQRQSTVMGVYGGVCENTGVIAGSALGGFIWSIWGPQTTFFSGTIAASLGAVICLAFVKATVFQDPSTGSSENDFCC
jgi:MFS family permease